MFRRATKTLGADTTPIIVLLVAPCSSSVPKTCAASSEYYSGHDGWRPGSRVSTSEGTLALVYPLLRAMAYPKLGLIPVLSESFHRQRTLSLGLGLQLLKPGPMHVLFRVELGQRGQGVRREGSGKSRSSVNWETERWEVGAWDI